jgi:hypothetical protein
MKINKTLSVLAVSAAVALSAYSAPTDVFGYLPLTISGTYTVGTYKVNAANTKKTYSTLVTAVNNKVLLAMLNNWYNSDYGTVGVAFPAGAKLAFHWDYTTQDPENGNVVVLDKTGVVIIYDPSIAATYSFVVGLDGSATSLNSPTDWLNPCVTGGSTAILAAGSNFYDSTLGAGTINYLFTGGFTLADTSSKVNAQGKGTGTSVYNATGVQNKVNFKYNAFGTQEQAGGTIYAAFDITISSGAVAATGASLTGSVPL